MYEKGQTITATIIDAAENEKCFARLDDGMGVFIQGYVAVGDTVEAQVYKIKKKFLEARYTRLVQPSPYRTSPVCPAFGVCGGCKWQHVTYEQQLEIKQKKVIDALEHLGGFSAPPVVAPIAAPDPYYYRNKIDFSFSDKRYLLEHEIKEQENQEPLTHASTTDPSLEDANQKPHDFALGFHAPRQFSKVIDIDHCCLAPEEMNPVLTTVRTFALQQNLSCYSSKTHEGFLRNLVLRKGFETDELMINIVTSFYDEEMMERLLTALRKALGNKLTTLVNNTSTRKNNSAFGEKEYVIDGPGIIHEVLGDYRFAISSNSFFQTNSKQALTLYRTVLEMAGLTGQEIVYDLYAGTGSISIFLAKHAKQIVGLECVDSAVKDAKNNASLNSIENVSFQPMDLKDLRHHADNIKASGAPDVIITDPPRAGMHPKAVGAMLALTPQRIIYVSCNPASLARDGKAIAEAGYTLTEVCPVDMFPHTHHIESVAKFERI